MNGSAHSITQKNINVMKKDSRILLEKKTAGKSAPHIITATKTIVELKTTIRREKKTQKERNKTTAFLLCTITFVEYLKLGSGQKSAETKKNHNSLLFLCKLAEKIMHEMRSN